MLPHGPRRRQTTGPFPAALQLPAESPLAGKTLRTEKAASSGLWIDVVPFDLHRDLQKAFSHPMQALGEGKLFAIGPVLSFYGGCTETVNSYNQLCRRATALERLRSKECHLASVLTLDMALRSS